MAATEILLYDYHGMDKNQITGMVLIIAINRIHI
jgi:hypothetical protein